MGTRPGIKVPGQKVPKDGFAEALLGCREGLMTLVPPSQGLWLHGRSGKPRRQKPSAVCILDAQIVLPQILLR